MVLGNLLRAGEHVSIYEPPKTGKKSLIHQTLYNLRNDGLQFIVSFVDMLNVRTLSDFLIKFGTAVMKSAASTPDAYDAIVREYLAGTHFVFDRVRFMTYDELVSLNWNPDMNDVQKMLELPQRIAEEKRLPYFIIFKEFQNLMNSDEYDDDFSGGNSWMYLYNGEMSLNGIASQVLSDGDELVFYYGYWSFRDNEYATTKIAHFEEKYFAEVLQSSVFFVIITKVEKTFSEKETQYGRFRL